MLTQLSQFQSENYEFTAKVTKNQTYIKIVFKTKYFHTNQIPQTVRLLEKHLPSIFNCVCYNEKNRSFKEEAADTELGHLFEHIILEYLCASKVKGQDEEVEFRGETKWNWNEEPQGTFHIYIDAGFKESYHFYQALRKATWMLNTLLSSA